MTEQPVRPASFLRRYFIPLGLIAVGVVVEIINWTTNITNEKLMPQFGSSAQTVLGRMFALLVVGLLLLWLLVTRQVGWRVKGIVFGLVALFSAGFALSIREIENTGNNHWVIRYRWQPTQDQRLSEYQQTVTSESPATDLDPAAPRFTDFLGPRRDGVVPGGRLISDLRANPPREVWRRPVGGGYAGCVIAGGLAVSIEQRGDQETVVAYEMQTGRDRWTRAYPEHFQESLGGNGPRATPTISGNEVFALGATGILVSLDLATGNENWKVNILEDARAENITWGMSGAPLVTDNLVIVNPGGTDGRSVLAYDRITGQQKWAAGGSRAAYSSPVLAELSEVTQVLVFDASGVAGYDLNTGAELWRYDFATFNGINVAQPLVIPDDRVLITAGYDAGAVLLQIQQVDGRWSVEPIWKNKNMKCKMSSPVFYDGFLYGLDDGILACLDAATGKRRWKKGRYGHGQLLLRDDVLWIMAEDGSLVLVAADPKQHSELSRLPVLPGDKTWNAPALAGNQLLVRNHFEAVLLELAESPE